MRVPAAKSMQTKNRSSSSQKTLPDARGSLDGRVEPTALEKRIAQAESALGTSRRRLLQKIMANPDETYFLSSRELAERCNVDPATIVRTAQALKYERYSDFARDLRSHFVDRITSYTLMKAAVDERRSVTFYAEHSLEASTHNLDELRTTLHPQRVIEIAKVFDRARRILVLGVDLAYSLSYHLAYGLAGIGYDAEAPLGSTGNLHQKTNALTSKDLAVAISFGRCLRDTVECAQRARENGAFTFGITDSSDSPIARTCDAYWIASTAGTSYYGFYVAPMAAIDALIVACAHLRPGRGLRMLGYKEDDPRSAHRWYSPEKPAKNSLKPHKEDSHGTVE